MSRPFLFCAVLAVPAAATSITGANAPHMQPTAPARDAALEAGVAALTRLSPLDPELGAKIGALQGRLNQDKIAAAKDGLSPDENAYFTGLQQRLDAAGAEMKRSALAEKLTKL